MKRILIVLLSLALLLACVPTPDHEFIVNKGGDTIEQKLSATPGPGASESAPHDPNAPVGALQRFPDRWDADVVAENDRITIAAHTDVRTRTDGLYPVYRTRPASITKEAVADMAIRLLDRPQGVSDTTLTKADWIREMQQYLNNKDRYEQWVAAGCPRDWPDVVEGDYSPETVEQTTNWYMEQIKNAPDSLDAEAINDWSGLREGPAQSFTLRSGEPACISFASDSLSIAKHCKSWGDIYTVFQYREDLEWQEGKYAQWMEPAIAREEAESVALKTVEGLGFYGFAVAGACEATLFDTAGSSHNAITGGWNLILVRDFGGYPQLASVVQSSQALTYGSGDGFVANAYIGAERMRLFVSADGVDVLEYASPKDVSGLVNANVALLSFDEAKARIADALLTCFPYDAYKDRPADAPKLEVEIFDLMLSTVTVRVKDSSDYYEMPCWIVSYDQNDPLRNERDFIISTRDEKLNDPIAANACLIINAVDGSIVHTDYGI